MNDQDQPVAPDIVALLESEPESKEQRPGTHPMPIEAARQQHEADVNRFSPPAGRDEVASVEDLNIPASGRALAARIYRPAAAPAGIILWIHGGGWVTGSTQTADVVARALCARSDLIVVSIPYRLAPEHPWPQGLDDARDAARWLVAHPLDGETEHPVLIGGDSAGGNLAAVIAQELAGTALAGQVLLYPVIALDEPQDAYASRVDNATGYYVEWSDVAWAIDKYVGVPDRSDPRVSPMRSVDAVGGVSAVIAVAGHDPLRDEGIAYARWLEQRDVSVDLLEFPGLLHGAFDMIGRSPSADQAMTDVATAIRDRLTP